MIAHPIDTIEGIGHALAHPMDTAHALGHAISETAKGVASGDGRSMGAALGTVGMLAIPGAGEAEGVEDAAQLGKLSELTETSTLAEGSNVLGKTSELGEAANASSRALTPASDFSEIQALKYANPEAVADAKTFTTRGVDENSAAEFLATPHGQQYMDQL